MVLYFDRIERIIMYHIRRAKAPERHIVATSPVVS